MHDTVHVQVKVVHLEPVRIGRVVLDGHLDNLIVILPDLGGCVLYDPLDNLWVLLGQPAKESWDTLQMSAVLCASDRGD